MDTHSPTEVAAVVLAAVVDGPVSFSQDARFTASDFVLYT